MKRAHKRTRTELYEEMRDLGLDITSSSDDDDEENEKENFFVEGGRVQREMEEKKDQREATRMKKAEDKTKKSHERQEEDGRKKEKGCDGSNNKEYMEKFAGKSKEMVERLKPEEVAWFSEVFRWLTDDTRSLEELAQLGNCMASHKSNQQEKEKISDTAEEKSVCHKTREGVGEEKQGLEEEEETEKYIRRRCLVKEYNLLMIRNKTW